MRQPRPTDRRGRSGYIYLIHNPDRGQYKIGLTVNPSARLRQLATASPGIKYVHLIKAGDRFEAEKRLHARFASRRLGGEWFNLSDQDVQAIKSIKIL